MHTCSRLRAHESCSGCGTIPLCLPRARPQMATVCGPSFASTHACFGPTPLPSPTVPRRSTRIASASSCSQLLTCARVFSRLVRMDAYVYSYFWTLNVRKKKYKCFHLAIYFYPCTYTHTHTHTHTTPTNTHTYVYIQIHACI